jgi:2-polyprenyl-6-methoxyphenol hydroxylase-like FAD-dependent oxidoreductase
MEEVVIVGGGPVGFINALGLAQAGVRVTLIEAEPRIRAPRYRVGRVVLAGDAAHVTNPTGGLVLTSGLLDSYALYPALAAVVLDGADDEVLDRYSTARRDVFVNRASPQAVANKRLVFHANGGGRELEEALQSLRRLATDAEFRQRLMFTRSLETPPLLGAPGSGFAV